MDNFNNLNSFWQIPSHKKIHFPPQIHHYFQSVDKFCALYKQGETGQRALLLLQEARKTHRRALTFSRELARRAGWEEAGYSPSQVPSR